MSDLIVKPPLEPDPKDDAPLNKYNNDNTSNGIDILTTIYSFFTKNEPVGFCTIKNYEKLLNLELNQPWLYRIALVPFLILDWVQSFIVVACISLILFLVVFASAKLVGFTDWIDTHFETKQKVVKVELVIPNLQNMGFKILPTLPQPTP